MQPEEAGQLYCVTMWSVTAVMWQGGEGGAEWGGGGHCTHMDQ